MIKLQVNNCCHLEVGYDTDKKVTVVKTYDHHDNVVESYDISDGDFVTMLNWYRYQKKEGNKDLLF